MPNPINTTPIQQFIQQVKAAELSQQREVKLDIKTAKMLAFCLGEVSAKLLEDYDIILKKLEQNNNQGKDEINQYIIDNYQHLNPPDEKKEDLEQEKPLEEQQKTSKKQEGPKQENRKQRPKWALTEEVNTI